ncbi:MAG: UpxY family transcription antiterminator [Desulfobacteraceae bacterium]|nr:UpxY family transcription antiterminator [Desulfobacteraceae bacterium]
MIQAKQWYTLLTRSRFENVVFSDIQKKSIEAFLPKIKVKSRRKDRKLMIDVPLFPGYLFVNISLDPLEHLKVLKTMGAVRLLGFSGGPVPVPDSHIESLRIITSTGNDIICGTTNTLKKGEMVMVVNGPFAGVKGEFMRHKGKERVIIKIETLGQFAGVEIAREDVEQLPDILS